jgi:CheY-like chemotaxis protein
VLSLHRDRFFRGLFGNESRRLSVLIVEDEPAFASVIEGVVRDTLDDVDVTVLHDGDDALHCLRRRAPDLLFLDVGLPGLNGVELCMTLRGERIAERTTIVCLSAAARAPDVALLRRLGVHHCLRKDGELVEAIERITRAL